MIADRGRLVVDQTPSNRRRFLGTTAILAGRPGTGYSRQAAPVRTARSANLALLAVLLQFSGMKKPLAVPPRWLPNRCFYVVLTIALLIVGACSDRAPKNTQPNVVVVVIDTLRPDHLGFNGHQHETAPFLAEIAERSTVFTNAFSTSSWTVPSVASLFTGLNPTRHGVLEGLFAHEVRQRKQKEQGTTILELSRIAEDVATMPELFRRGGYQCFGIGANHNIGAGFGFRRGFHRFVRLEGAQTDALGVLEQLRKWTPALEAQKPYFLYLHLNDPHFPYHTREEHLHGSASTQRQELMRQYDSEIGYADHYLKEIANLLRWDDSTILVVLSDHGEEFEEHGNYEHRVLSLFGEVNRMLCIVSAPAHGVLPQRVASNLSVTDLLPTLLDLAQLPPSLVDGRSMVPLLRDDATGSDFRNELEQRPILAHRIEWGGDRQLWSVIFGRWKLISSSGALGADQLYDLATDPEEHHDRSAEHQDIVASLSSMLDDFRVQSSPRTPIQLEIDASDRETLRKLGYVE